jgi:hypothetical protein
MSNKFINVHSFDGKLIDKFIPTKTYTISEKKHKFNELVSKLSNYAAKQTVKSIISDLDIDRGNNFQIENKIDASDILIHLLELNNNSDILLSLEEQLKDINNLGMCPSGRCTRLLQLWLAYKDN